MPDVTNGIFSDYCYDKMWDLFKTPEDEVGSKFSGDRRGRSITNCIIYVSNVLIYGHTKIGHSFRNERIKELGIDKQDGSKLANYLVREVGWKAHYYNPDTDFKGDGGEHSVSYLQVLNKRHYLPNSSNLPVNGTIVNYKKRNKGTKRIWVPSGINIPIPPISGIPIPMPIDVSNENTAILEKFSKVKFAFGIARGGTHTFLVSYGEVFEVHWEQEGAKLYGKVKIENYEWLSGAIVVPPDSTFTSDEIKGR